MKMNKDEVMTDKSGLTIIETVLILATAAVIVFVGFAIFQASQDVVQIEDPMHPEDTQRESDAEDGIPQDPEIETADDMESAIEELEDIDFDKEESGADELEAEADEL